MIQGIGHVAYYVSDMDRAIAFYCGKLGMTRFFDMPDDEGRPWIVYLRAAPGQFVELFYGGTAAKREDRAAGYAHLCLLSDDVEADIAALQAKGVEIDAMPRKGKDQNVQAWIHDPDGNPVELMTICPESRQAQG